MVFISYKSDPDYDIALKVSDLLKGEGVNVWMAPKSIDDNFVYEVPHAINTCEIFVIIISKNTVHSEQVMNELLLAVKHNKKVIPLIFEKKSEFRMPDSYEYQLGQKQWRYFSLEDQNMVNWLVEQCKMGEPIIEMSVDKFNDKKITLMKGDYQENMDYVINNYPEKLEHIAFAMGIDCSSSLKISSKKGILKWVCKYLDEKYGIKIDVLQDLVDDAKIRQLGHSDKNQEMKFKDSVLITVLLPNPDQGKEELKLKILLIANSRKKSSYKTTHDVDEVEGIDSREIIVSLFNKLPSLREDIRELFIGAMGTNGLEFPYEVCVSEIFNCYLYAQRMNISPDSLWFSMRKEDMERADLSSDEIINYISTVTHFFQQ